LKYNPSKLSFENPLETLERSKELHATQTRLFSFSGAIAASVGNLTFLRTFNILDTVYGPVLHSFINSFMSFFFAKRLFSK
jgi:hypothetical protein